MILILLLKVLTFRGCILELLLHFGNSSLMLLAGGSYRLKFGSRSLGHRLLLCRFLLGLPQLSLEPSTSTAAAPIIGKHCLA